MKKFLLLAAVSLAAQLPAQTDPAAPAPRAVGILARTSQPSGIYHVGEKITVRIQLRDGATDVVDQVQYTAKLHTAKVIAAGTLALTNRSAEFQTVLTEPGSLLFTISGQTAAGEKFSTFAGATADFQHIRWPLPVPDDFDAFWDSKVAESKQLPLAPRARRPGFDGNDRSPPSSNPLRSPTNRTWIIARSRSPISTAPTFSANSHDRNSPANIPRCCSSNMPASIRSSAKMSPGRRAQAGSC